MPRFETRVRIHRSAAEVFDFVGTNADRNNPRWEEEVQGWSDVSPRPIRTGTTAVMHRLEGGKRRDVALLCTEFDEGRRIAWKHAQPGPFQFALSFTTVPTPSGECDLTVVVDITLAGPFRLMSPLVDRRLKKNSTRLIGNMKALLDGLPATERAPAAT